MLILSVDKKLCVRFCLPWEQQAFLKESEYCCQRPCIAAGGNQRSVAQLLCIDLTKTCYFQTALLPSLFPCMPVARYLFQFQAINPLQTSNRKCPCFFAVILLIKSL